MQYEVVNQTDVEFKELKQCPKRNDVNNRWYIIQYSILKNKKEGN